MKICKTCKNWDRNGEWHSGPYSMKPCLLDRENGFRTPPSWHAEDSGRWCEKHDHVGPSMTFTIADDDSEAMR